MSDIRKPSTWFIAFGTAGAFTSAHIMAQMESGQTLMPWPYYVAEFLRVGCTLLAVIHAVYLVLIGLGMLPAVREWWARLHPPKPAEPPAPPPSHLASHKVMYTRLIPGTKHGRTTYTEIEDERPARWSAWQQTALEVLAWNRLTKTLKYKAMVGAGRPFKRNEDAAAVFVEMARHGLVNHTNGITTTLADAPRAVFDRIRTGEIEWTRDADPPAILPAPIRDGAASPLIIGQESPPANESA